MLNSASSRLTHMKKVFISYAHQDAPFKDALATHFVYLRSIGLIDDWHDSMIDAGGGWRTAIDAHLNAADIIVLLISSDFLASQYCRDVELYIALKRWEKQDAEIVPVLIRDCIWEASPLRDHQMLPSGAEPVDCWPHPDKAWKEVAQTVRRFASRGAPLPLSAPATNSQPTKMSTDSGRAGDALDAGRADLIYQKMLEEALHQCDRNDQERDLGEAVLRHRATAPRRPLVCLMHGEGKECHAQFVRRLRAKFIPQLLKRWYPERPEIPSCAGYELPLSLDRYTPGNVRTAIEEEFATITNRDPSVYKSFASREQCVLLHFTAFANDYSARDLKRLDEFLHYWCDLDDLPPERLLIVCVNFRYRSHHQRQKAGWSLLRWWRLEKRNRRVRKLMNELPGREAPGISVAALRELQPVKQIDVEVLIGRDERLGLHFDLQTVDEIFSNEDPGVVDGHMRMADVIDRLMKHYSMNTVGHR
jgi:hypothetical protein